MPALRRRAVNKDLPEASDGERGGMERERERRREGGREREIDGEGGREMERERCCVLKASALTIIIIAQGTDGVVLGEVWNGTLWKPPN